MEKPVDVDALQPDSITADFVPHRRDSFASVEIDGEGLLFDEVRGTWHFLNPIAQVIWNCCDGTGSVGEIARDMSQFFGEELEVVLAGVLDTVRQFGQQGLLEGVEPVVHQSFNHDHDEHDHDHDELDHDHEEGGDEPRFIPVPDSA